jgi:hypothetical protein
LLRADWLTLQVKMQIEFTVVVVLIQGKAPEQARNFAIAIDMFRILFVFH